MLSVLAPETSLWRMSSTAPAILTPVYSALELRGHPPPMLFIHGVEYSGPSEALNDLVLPMLRHIGLKNLEHRSLYLLSWNSLIFPREKTSEFFNASKTKQLVHGMRELLRCRQYLSNVEQRAKQASSFLSPFILEWNSIANNGPIVITHSMGSLVWAEALKHILESSSMLIRPGIWWSLQPALTHKSFTDNGEYRMVSKLYTGQESSRAMVWYSRLDFILSSLYLLSKRSLALGQVGCPQRVLPQRDITGVVGEAHGMKHFKSLRGDFFNRAGSLIKSEAVNLGII